MMKSAIGGTKRRRYTTVFPYQSATLSRRVTRLAKYMRMNNPPHVLDQTPGGVFAAFTTNGGLYDLCAGISQVEDCNLYLG